MHGLINATLQFFVEDNYGADRWAAVARRAGLKTAMFETMLVYEDTVTNAVVRAIAQEFARPPEAVLEDVGIYLVTHPKRQALRRLLRFSGTDFRDFLYALDDLPDRMRLAVPDLRLPSIAVSDLGGDRFEISCRSPFPGAGCVLMGLLRAMADDYGALVVLDHHADDAGCDVFRVTLVKEAFMPGRAFDLVAGEGA
ncbi:Haem-NO-binding [Roseivivax lentus]|uniref:Haem-NO-binding n=1 Tax=Roseivivax lentus TaxID=633194 RepID=A0A1N7PNU9_9RHOB|nr:heme NO-binding domain-containing protein [Roseivivax lentus]SIT12268.1 Haem-NO-binding [Roseivivax lentus]